MDTKVMQFIDKWSFSRLSKFEQCPQRAYIEYILKVPEPERPLPPGKTEHANDRGTRIHQAAEDFVSGKRDDVINELRHFGPEFMVLRQLYNVGKVSLEGEWATDREWNPIDWSDKGRVWQRLKLDANVHLSDYQAIVIDYKSGKRFGNEIKHTEQTQLYAINTFLRYPKLEEITTELWYTDIDELHAMTYRRDQALRFKPRWDSRANKMTTATDFPARPSIYTCKWCPFGPSGTGHCPKGV